jgi:hypothetical protein
MPANQRLGLEIDRSTDQRGEQPIKPDEEQSIGGAKPVLGGADRFSTSSWWWRNTISASRAARDLNSPTRNPPSNVMKSIMSARR